ncbi:hypothetical protein PYR91_34760 [Sphaerisporangium sp. TRM90804]|nr:hypothetical protein [Sphaerisporangium sp. TRM90804]
MAGVSGELGERTPAAYIKIDRWIQPRCRVPAIAKDLRRRGGKVVVVDPRRTRTAAAADEHLFVRPGTDAHRPGRPVAVHDSAQPGGDDRGDPLPPATRHGRGCGGIDSWKGVGHHWLNGD